MEKLSKVYFRGTGLKFLASHADSVLSSSDISQGPVVPEVGQGEL